MNHPASSPQAPAAEQPAPRTLNPFFRITIIAGALFVITILAMIASALGAAPSSPARTTFDEYAGWLLAVEVVTILASAFLAMAGDTGTPQTEPSKTSEPLEQANDSTDDNAPPRSETD